MTKAVCDIFGINNEVLWKEGEVIPDTIYDVDKKEYVSNPYLKYGITEQQNSSPD